MQRAFDQMHTVINLPNGINISILPKRINITSEIIDNTKEKVSIHPEKIGSYELYISRHEFLANEDINDSFKNQEESAYSIEQSDTDLLEHLEEKSQICIVKKQEALEYRKEILRLKGSMNRLKAGPNITESDMESGDIASVLLQKLGLGKYKKFLDPYMPKINQAIAEKKDDIIETIQANNKKAEPDTTNTETANTL